MKFKALYFLVFVVISNSAIAQRDTLNNYDVKNNKTGWWMVYLDSDLAVVEDSAKAVYYRYSYFDGKFDYFNMGRIGTKKNPIITTTTEIHKGIASLDGEYKANFTDGKTRFALSAKNGRLVEYREYYPNGVLKTRFDYAESCGDTQFHYCIYEFNKDGSLKNKSTIQTP